MPSMPYDSMNLVNLHYKKVNLQVLVSFVPKVGLKPLKKTIHLLIMCIIIASKNRRRISKSLWRMNRKFVYLQDSNCTSILTQIVKLTDSIQRNKSSLVETYGRGCLGANVCAVNICRCQRHQSYCFRTTITVHCIVNLSIVSQYVFLFI